MTFQEFTKKMMPLLALKREANAKLLKMTWGDPREEEQQQWIALIQEEIDKLHEQMRR